MMDKLRTAPLPLRRKLLLTALAGAAFFLVGLAAILFSLDTVTALLSGILAIGLAFKTAELYRLIITRHYTDIDGICIAITQTPLRKYRNMSVRRAITMSDPALGCINPKDDHTVHPIGYFAR